MPKFEDDPQYQDFQPKGVPWEVANEIAHYDLVAKRGIPDDFLAAILGRKRTLEKLYRDYDVADLLEEDNGSWLVISAYEALSRRTLQHMGFPGSQARG